MFPTQDRAFSAGTTHRRTVRSLGRRIVATGLLLVPAGVGGADVPPARDQPRAQVAATPHEAAGSDRRTTDLAATVPPGTADQAQIDRAKAMMATSRAHYDAIRDYTCTFYKREAFDGKLSDYHVMNFKARTQPLSIYIKCATPRQGREAIWIKGKNSGKVVAHDSGMFKVLAGTMYLDPRGDIAMEDNHHPITEAGLGNMIDTIRRGWDVELKSGVTQVRIVPKMKVGDRDCTMIETTHPRHDPAFVFHRARVYIDDQLGLPIRLEGYDWPKSPGAAPELVEEYTYSHLKVNTGLTERDFDPANPSYAYGRF